MDGARDDLRDWSDCIILEIRRNATQAKDGQPGMNEATGKRRKLKEIVKRFISQVKRVLSNPRDFFKEEAAQQGYLDPTLFASGCILVPKAAYALLWAPFTLGFSFLWMLPSALYALASVYALAALTYGAARMVREDFTFEAVFRCVAYSWLGYVLLLVPIPIVNHFFIACAFYFLLQFALQEIVKLSRQQALSIAAAPAIVLFIVGAITSICAIGLVIMGAYKIGAWLFM
ncbi:MAG: hypothetical protein GC154_03060 [bacterium]|nr:hypothetical protein [bacterium]